MDELKGYWDMLETNRFKGLMLLLGGATIITTIATFSYMGGSDAPVMVGQGVVKVKGVEEGGGPPTSLQTPPASGQPQLTGGTPPPPPGEENSSGGDGDEEKEEDENQPLAGPGGTTGGQAEGPRQITPDESTEPSLNPREVDANEQNNGEVPDQVFSNGRIRTVGNPG